MLCWSAMAAPAALKSPATYEDLRQVPDHLVAEILDGDLYATPRPRPRHAHAASVLGSEILGPFHVGRGGPGGWWILFEPELHLGSDVLVPDLAGWRRERLAAIPDAPAITLAPDWVCEVLSPSTAGLDRGKKLAIYARQGVGHVWLVDPQLETLEVFALSGSQWVLVGTYIAGAVVRAEPFAAVELNLALLWPPD
jgi:Uma2 family endonuclease